MRLVIPIFTLCFCLPQTDLIKVKRSVLKNVIDEGIALAEQLRSEETTGIYDRRLHGTSISEFSYPHELDVIYHENAVVLAIISGLLQKKFLFLNKKSVLEFLRDVDLNDTKLSVFCRTNRDLQSHECDEEVREMDGFCNNLKHTWYGMTNLPQRRVLSPDYGDGVNTIRLNRAGRSLPNARIITRRIFSTKSVFKSEMTMISMLFGQFLSHDITLTPLPTGRWAPELECCNSLYKHPWCFELELDPKDPFYSQYNQTCMQMFRSLITLPKDCQLGPRLQGNKVTSFIDASVVYGSTIEVANGLKELVSAKMRTQPHLRNRLMKNMLPNLFRSHVEECIYHKRTKFPCFKAGDERANENNGLLSMQTIWVRLHNNIVDRLKWHNTHWTRQKIFEEARTMVAAMLQHITYSSWLPLIIGQERMEKNKLRPLSKGYFYGYDEELDAMVSVEVSSAALRFGHSLVKDSFHKMNVDESYVMDTIVHNEILKPKSIHLSQYPNGLDPLLKGLSQQRCNQVDNTFSESLINHLFDKGKFPYGRDLISTNIMRSRDLGVPGYTKYVSHCGLGEIRTWRDMKKLIPDFIVKNLSKIYEHPEDVDLFVGGISEMHVVGGEVGPTFACLLTDQFYRLKHGDRFWYENGPIKNSNLYHTFTLDQLDEIRKVTLSKIICDTTDTITKIQRNVFKVLSFENPMVNCEDLPQINFLLWKENVSVRNFL